MVIIKKSVLNQFGAVHPDAIPSLNDWYSKVKTADWRNHADLKKVFPSADYVNNERYVFNIGGNKYRLITLINFKIRTLYIKFIGTHAEYDKVDAKTVEQF